MSIGYVGRPSLQSDTSIRPNEVGQSNMDPTWAATVWKQHIEPYCQAGYKCATPAMSSRPNGFAWMQTFMDNCQGCTVSIMLIWTWWGND